MQFAIQCNGSSSAPGSWQWRNRCPFILRDFIDIGVVVWISILFNEAAKRIDATFKRDNGHMVSASRKWGCQVPLIGLRFIDVVVAPVDAPFAIAAYDMKSACPFSGSCHFAAWNGQ